MSDSVWDCILGSVPYVASVVAFFGALHLWVWYESRRSPEDSQEKEPTSEKVSTAPTRNVSLSWIREHLALAATLAAFGVVLLRTLLVTADINAALALLRATGPVAVLLGILADASGTIALIATIEVHTWYRRSLGIVPRSTELLRWYIFLGTILVTSTLVGCTIFILLIVVLLGLSFWPRRGVLPAQKVKLVVQGSRFVLVWVFALTYLLGNDVWLPAETVLTEDHKPYVGYVLEADSEWTTLLLENERRVEILSTREILSRRLCQPEHQEREPSLITLIRDDDREITPTCDTNHSDGESVESSNDAAPTNGLGGIPS